MSGSSFTASLGDIMLITIQKVVETSGTMLGAVGTTGRRQVRWLACSRCQVVSLFGAMPLDSNI